VPLFPIFQGCACIALNHRLESGRTCSLDPRRSGDGATGLERDVTSLGATRNQFIAKGMVWSPNHRGTLFTVPLFDQFMRRILPGDDGVAEGSGRRSAITSGREVRLRNGEMDALS